jgi:hypothetical protein
VSTDLVAMAEALEAHVSATGWDQPPRLYALVDTAELLANEPQLAAIEPVAPEPGTSLTPVEQDELPRGDLEEFLAGMGWPHDVLGCALVHEVLTDPEDHEVRLAVAVLRTGERGCCVRVRRHDGATDDVLRGDDLVPNLALALEATLH